MIRRFAFATLLLTAVACGDDSDDPKPTETPKDGGIDAAAPPMLRVDNTGAACTMPSDCTGSSFAQCLKNSPSSPIQLAIFPASVPYPGGFCSATCTDDIECKGTGAVCPLAPLVALGGPTIAGFIGNFSTCMVKCAVPSDCRTTDGWRCVSLNEAVPQLGTLAGGAGDAGTDGGLNQTFCFPPAVIDPDAGVADGGTDAGASDAGTDAAAADAATDATAADATTDV